MPGPTIVLLQALDPEAVLIPWLRGSKTHLTILASRVHSLSHSCRILWHSFVLSVSGSQRASVFAVGLLLQLGHG